MSVYSTNYSDTLIVVPPSCLVKVGTTPSDAGNSLSDAEIQFALLSHNKYALTSDDLYFAMLVRRTNTNPDDTTARRKLLESQPPCLRSSILPKVFGWGLHHNSDSRIGLVCIDSDEYSELISSDAVRKVATIDR